MDGELLPDPDSAHRLELTRRALLAGIAGIVASETAEAKKRRQKKRKQRDRDAHSAQAKKKRRRNQGKRRKRRNRAARPAPVDPPAPPVDPPAPPLDPTDPPTPPDEPPVPPDDPAVPQLMWFLERINGAPVTEDDIRERFEPLFLQTLTGAFAPPTEAIRRVTSIGEQLAPVTVKSYWTPPEGPDPWKLYPIIKSRGDTYRMGFVHLPPDPYQIYDLDVQGFMSDIREEWPTGLVQWDDWAEFDRRSAAFAPLAGVLAQELGDGSPRTIHSHQADVELEIGSVFKLYVLGALAKAVEDGDADWFEVLPVRAEWRSFDSGYLDTLPAPRLVDHAVLMWTLSDNTATDHLLFRLGRERVEAMLEPMGHQNPSRNRPFLSTREYFALNIAVPQQRAAAYAEANVAERLRLLDEEILGTDLGYFQAFDWIRPRHHWEIGWFATPSDMTRAMVALDEMSRRPGLDLVRAIMGQSSSFDSIMTDLSVWPVIFAKNGGTKGVQTYVWLLERNDGKRFTLAIGHNDPRKPIDFDALYIAYAGAANLLAQEGIAPRAAREARPAQRRADPADSLRGIVSDAVLEAIRKPDPRRPQIP